MERPTADIFQAALRVIEQTSAAADPDAFRRAVIREVRAVVPGHIVGYNEVDLARQTVFALTEPAPDMTLLEVFSRHVGEHPVIAAHANGQGDRALAISDFLSQEEYEATGLYQNVFRLQDVQDQIAIQFSPPGDVIVALAICRRSRGFSGDERTTLELLRPHLVNAYMSARARALGGHVRAVLEGAVPGGAGMVVVGATGRVTDSDEEGRRLLRTVGWRETASAAPPPVLRWLEGRRTLHGPARLILDGQEGAISVAGAFDAPAEGETLLLLRPVTPRPQGPALTPREQQILELVAEGLSDAQIATRLRISAGTVRKHLERVRAKLGVPTRAAAVASGLARSG